MQNVIKLIDIARLEHMAIITVGLWLLVIVAAMIDLWTGVEKARATGEKIHSGGYRRTFTKIGEYWRVLVMLFCIDLIGELLPWYHLPFASMLGTVAVIMIEGRSVIENLRAKKSHAAEVPDMLQHIIKCKDVEQAMELLKKISNTECHDT